MSGGGFAKSRHRSTSMVGAAGTNFMKKDKALILL